MLLFIEQLEAANTAEDLEAGGVALAALQGHFAAAPVDALDTVEVETRSRLMAACLEYDRLTRCGPVVENPQGHVEQVEGALDNNDGDLARKLVGELQGSFASGGPSLTRVQGIRLAKLFMRPEWDTGTLVPFTAPSAPALES